MRFLGINPSSSVVGQWGYTLLRIRRGLKRLAGALLFLGSPGLLLFTAGCQSNDRFSSSPVSGDDPASLPGETPGRRAQPLPPSDHISGLSSGTVADRPGLEDYPRFLQMPIILSDYEIIPNEIEMWLGQDVILDIFNVGSRAQSFAIGRNPRYENGVPVGFGVDFFQGGSFVDSAQGDVRLFQLADSSREGYAGNYRGVMAQLPTFYAQFLSQIRNEQHWRIDNSPGPHPVGTVVNVSIEFQVTREMLGEWTYASFAGEGEFYNKGLRGRLVVKSAFDLP